MKAATEAVIAGGYKKLVFVCPPINGNPNENIYVHKKRLEGFNQVASKHKEIKADNLLDWSYLEQISKMDVPKDMAFVCTSDEIALEIMMLMKERGVVAGKDYGLHGFDAIDTLKYITPSLNSVNNNVEIVAHEAMKLLLKLIENRDSVPADKRVIVPFSLIDGETI